MNTRASAAARGPRAGPRGFTLAEMLVAVVIATLVVGASVFILVQTMRGVRASEDAVALVARGRAALDWAARDLATGHLPNASSDVRIGEGGASFEFDGIRRKGGKATPARIRYARDAGTPSRLLRSFPGTAEDPEEILPYVKDFRVESWGPDATFVAAAGPGEESLGAALPAALRITLTFADEEGKRERTLRRVVFLGKRGLP